MPEKSVQDEGKRKDERNYYKDLSRLGNAQWWATFGAALFTGGSILIALSYSTLRIIGTIPANYTGAVPSIGFQAYSVGIAIASLGFILMLYSRYKLAKLSWAPTPV